MSEEKKAPEYEYVLSGRDDRGRRVVRIVEAPTADEAVRRFGDAGHAEVVLHTDDLVAPLYKPSAAQRPFSLRTQLWARTVGPVGAFGIALALGIPWTYRLFWWMVLLAAGWLVFQLVVDWPPDMSSVLAVAILLLPAGLTVLAASIALYQADFWILRAVGQARWDDVLRLVRRRKSKGPSFENLLWKAEALAGLGHLPEALAEFDRVADLPDVPPYIYWYFQAVVYLSARDREKALTVLARAVELAPTASTALTSYAHNLLIVRWDVGQARDLLRRARSHAVADSSLPYLLLAEGLLALEEGRPEDAVVTLTEAVGRLESFARGNPALLPHTAWARARLCLAYAALGDTASARRHLRKAGPLLVAHGEEELLKECEQAVGVAGRVQ